jgi:hypothetical protein
MLDVVRGRGAELRRRRRRLTAIAVAVVGSVTLLIGILGAASAEPSSSRPETLRTEVTTAPRASGHAPSTTTTSPPPSTSTPTTSDHLAPPTSIKSPPTPATDVPSSVPSPIQACAPYEVAPSMSTDQPFYAPGALVTMTVGVRNDSAHDCTQPTGFRVVITNTDGAIVYDTTQASNYLGQDWTPGRDELQDAVWNQNSCAAGETGATCSGPAVPAGTYYATVQVNGDQAQWTFIISASTASNPTPSDNSGNGPATP